MSFRLFVLFILTAIGLAGCDISPEDHRSQSLQKVRSEVNLTETIAVRAHSHSMQKRFAS